MDQNQLICPAVQPQATSSYIVPQSISIPAFFDLLTPAFTPAEAHQHLMLNWLIITWHRLNQHIGIAYLDE
jgi:hypothetical protein